MPDAGLARPRSTGGEAEEEAVAVVAEVAELSLCRRPGRRWGRRPLRRPSWARGSREWSLHTPSIARHAAPGCLYRLIPLPEARCDTPAASRRVRPLSGCREAAAHAAPPPARLPLLPAWSHRRHRPRHRRSSREPISPPWV